MASPSVQFLPQLLLLPLKAACPFAGTSAAGSDAKADLRLIAETNWFLLQVLFLPALILSQKLHTVYLLVTKSFTTTVVELPLLA
jgi:hypothetical protein